MIIIQSMNNYLNRIVSAVLDKHLGVMPAVVVSGARQVGKSTLVQQLLSQERQYFTLDDFDVLDSARNSPDELLGGHRLITLDEVQREPSLLLPVKRAIDHSRQAGQFLLTASANLLSMQKAPDSLAGRASYLTLWPMTRREQQGLGKCGVWENLLANDEKHWIEILSDESATPVNWIPFAKQGGFPFPAIRLTDETERNIWFDGYLRTYLERDLQSLSTISSLPDINRLIRAVCLRLGQLCNQTELGRDVSMPQATVHRYLNLLETSYLLIRLPAYSVNRTKRLVKSPKMYWSDTGLAVRIAGYANPTGSHFENFVLNDLVAWRDSRSERADLFYWRTVSGTEVDFVIESKDRLLPIEVKTTNRPSLGHIRHLRLFRDEYRSNSRAGLLLHSGTELNWLTDSVLAAPWWRVM